MQLLVVAMNLFHLCFFFGILTKVSAFLDSVSVTASRDLKISVSQSNNAFSLFEMDLISCRPSRRGVLTNSMMKGVALSAPFSSVMLLLQPLAANAKIDPDTAYLNLRAAREELVQAGRTYFPKKDLEGLRDFLDNEDLNINNYETNAQVLLESKRLDAESKKEIGTIRRYGVGADVIIMYGGLKGELSDDNEVINFREVEKYYVRTLDSLEEVIAICRSNKGFKSLE